MSDTFEDSAGDTWHRGNEPGTVTLAGRIFRFGTAGMLEVRQQYRAWEYVRNMPHFSQGAREAIAALWPETTRPEWNTAPKVDTPVARNIVQIVGLGDGSLASLCTDGTVWRCNDYHSWCQLPSIPQD